MNSLEKSYKLHTLDSLKLKMLSLDEFNNAATRIKLGDNPSLPLSLILLYKKSLSQPPVFDGVKIFEYSDMYIYFYKNMIDRVGKFENPGKMIARHSGAHSVSTKYEKITVYDIGVSLKSELLFNHEANQWDLEFIRGLESTAYGIDWWVTFNF